VAPHVHTSLVDRIALDGLAVERGARGSPVLERSGLEVEVQRLPVRSEGRDPVFLLFLGERRIEGGCPVSEQRRRRQDQPDRVPHGMPPWFELNDVPFRIPPDSNYSGLRGRVHEKG